MDLNIIAKHSGWWEVFNGNRFIGKFWNKDDRWAFLHGSPRPKRIPHNLTRATEIAQWMSLTDIRSSDLRNTLIEAKKRVRRST